MHRLNGKLRKKRNILIIRLKKDGLTNKQIAPQVNLQPTTVKHILSYLKKNRQGE